MLLQYKLVQCRTVPEAPGSFPRCSPHPAPCERVQRHMKRVRITCSRTACAVRPQKCVGMARYSLAKTWPKRDEAPRPLHPIPLKGEQCGHKCSTERPRTHSALVPPGCLRRLGAIYKRTQGQRHSIRLTQAKAKTLSTMGRASSSLCHVQVPCTKFSTSFSPCYTAVA